MQPINISNEEQLYNLKERVTEASKRYVAHNKEMDILKKRFKKDFKFIKIPKKKPSIYGFQIGDHFSSPKKD